MQSCTTLCVANLVGLTCIMAQLSCTQSGASCSFCIFCTMLQQGLFWIWLLWTIFHLCTDQS